MERGTRGSAAVRKTTSRPRNAPIRPTESTATSTSISGAAGLSAVQRKDGHRGQHGDGQCFEQRRQLLILHRWPHVYVFADKLPSPRAFANKYQGGARGESAERIQQHVEALDGLKAAHEA